MVEDIWAKLLRNFCEDRPCFSSKTISSLFPKSLELVGVLLSLWFLKFCILNVAISSAKTAFLARRLLGKQQIWKYKQVEAQFQFTFHYEITEFKDKKIYLVLVLGGVSLPVRTRKHNREKNSAQKEISA